MTTFDLSISQCNAGFVRNALHKPPNSALSICHSLYAEQRTVAFALQSLPFVALCCVVGGGLRKRERGVGWQLLACGRCNQLALLPHSLFIDSFFVAGAGKGDSARHAAHCFSCPDMSIVRREALCTWIPI